jgi:L-2-hydroxycarboxylate dehydrogenase (NAD+)
MTRLPAATLVEFASTVLQAVDVPASDANVTATRLVEADERGRTGHGLIRLPSYVQRIRAGGVNVRPAITVRHETPVSALIDGDNGLGQLVMTQAAELAISKASQSGLAWVGTTASNHAGAAGLYPLLAADAGLVALYLAVANANGMPPWGGTNPLLGTNPLAVAFPAQPHPFLLDIATTAASHGTIKVAAQQGVAMPEGWVIDTEGRPITDPQRAHEGYLVPMGGYKGSGLTIAIGLLAGVLNGAAFGASVVDHRHDDVTPTNTGQAILVLRPDLFGPREQILAALTEHLDALRDSGGPVRMPGDGAAASLADTRRRGVPVPAPLARDLSAVAAAVGVQSPLSEAS